MFCMFCRGHTSVCRHERVWSLQKGWATLMARWQGCGALLHKDICARRLSTRDKSLPNCVPSSQDDLTNVQRASSCFCCYDQRYGMLWHAKEDRLLARVTVWRWSYCVLLALSDLEIDGWQGRMHSSSMFWPPLLNRMESVSKSRFGLVSSAKQTRGSKAATFSERDGGKKK